MTRIGWAIAFEAGCRIFWQARGYPSPSNRMREIFAREWLRLLAYRAPS